MNLNVIRKSPIFLCQVTNFSLRNRPYEALKRGSARGGSYIHFIQPPEDKEKLGWARNATALTKADEWAISLK
jgi:hypothetical protein